MTSVEATAAVETVEIFGKTAFAKAYAAKFGGTQATAAAIYEGFIEIVKEAVDAGSTVRLNGIGSLREKVLPAGTGTKPGTNETVEYGERRKYALKATIRKQ